MPAVNQAAESSQALTGAGAGGDHLHTRGCRFDVRRDERGNESVIGFLVGQVMKASGGSANPKLAQELLRERLSG